MIIAVTLDGWSASFRKKSERFSAVVERELEKGRFYRHLSARSLFIWTRTRKVLRFIRSKSNNLPENVLLLCGKSLGGWNMVTRIVPKIEGLRYSKVGLVTVDPCTPYKGNLTPNLNDHRLVMDGRVDRGVNLYARIDGGPGPAGAMVVDGGVRNVALHGVDHYSIVDSPAVAGTVAVMLDFLEGDE